MSYKSISMQSLQVSAIKPCKLNNGFTLIELVIVIIILGILSVTVVPKLFSSNGFSEYAYRTDAIAKLRLIQTKAMQQTSVLSTVPCASMVLITATKLGAPDNCTIAANLSISALSFNNATNANSETQLRATTVKIDDQDSANVGFSTDIANNSFAFDSMGRPFTLDDTNFYTVPCNPCTITITGEQAIVIQIEQEGYIHAL